MQQNAYRNRPLTGWEIRFNKLISKDRYKVERTFGGMKRWFGAEIAKYVGLNKTQTQHVLEAIATTYTGLPGLLWPIVKIKRKMSRNAHRINKKKE